jgi:ribosomal protein L37AE/L43A
VSFNPEGSYDCPRCSSHNTHVVTANILWCYDCRNQATHDDYLEATRAHIRKLASNLTKPELEELIRILQSA